MTSFDTKCYGTMGELSFINKSEKCMRNMKIFLKLLSNLLYSVIVLLVAQSSVYAETLSCNPISALPATISQPGTYCLTQNMYYSPTSGAAITITSNNVVLDFNGFSISGLNSATLATGVLGSNVSGVHVRNGQINLFLVGINLGGTQSVSPYKTNIVENMQLTFERRIGIAIDSGIVTKNLITEVGGGQIAESPSLLPSIGILVGSATASGNLLVIDNDILGVKKGAQVVIPGIGVMVNNGTGVVVDGLRVSRADAGVLVNPNVTSGKYREVITTSVTTPFAGGTPVGYNN